MENKPPMTIEDLAVLVQEGFGAVRKEMQTEFTEIKAYVDTRVDHLEARLYRKFDALEERTFNPEEKESMVVASETYNQQLEDSALGARDITLTRSEYDATAIAAEFPNRFTAPAEAFAD